MKRKLRIGSIILLICFLLLVFGGCSSSATKSADKYPSKPITIVVPYNPGGGVDTATRTIQASLQNAVGQQIVVENRPGGGMSIGYNHVAGANPDGYTFMAAPIPTMIFTDLTLEVLKAKYADFKPVASWVNDDCSPLVVSTKSPYQSVKEFIDASKNKTLRLGLSGGAYSTDHMTYALLAESTGVKFHLVPYGSSGDALAALEGGHVDGILASLVTAITAQEAGRAKILAVSKGERVSVAPNIPTFKEEGYDVVIEFHIGLFAPPNTPDEIVKLMSEKVLLAANSDEFKKRVQEVKSPTGAPMDLVQWKKYCTDEYERWKKNINILAKYPLG